MKLPTVATPRLVIPPQDIPPAAVEAALARFGDDARRSAGDDADSVVCLLPCHADRLALADALGGDFSHIVELDEDGRADGLWLGAPPPTAGFHLSLTTATAFSIQPALLICDTLVERGVLPPERRSPVELCLHEAIANGVVHGNLGISSSAKDQPDGYRVFSQLVNAQLQNPVCRRRRLDVVVMWGRDELRLLISDGGDGFDTDGLRVEPDGAARSGRGFMFMRALSDGLVITAGGRCTALRFDL